MKLPFPRAARDHYYKLLEEVFDSNYLTEGQFLEQFECQFSSFTGLDSLGFSSGGSALYALFRFANVDGHEVILPANTFYATAISAKMAGATVIYADCNKEDLCISLDDLKRKVTPKTKAVCVVHIGGHISFEIEKISEFCSDNDLYLIEDCAHAHGASFKGDTGGSWGLGGAYSFYATKTMPLGEGGMVCSKNQELLEWVKKFRNYGKTVKNGRVSYDIGTGFNGRMNEITAALGLVQLDRLPEILEWKGRLAEKLDKIFKNRIHFPEDMASGYYKYIVFDYDLKEEVGKVFSQSDFGPEIENSKYLLPNSRWVAKHHKCVPIWFGWEHAEKPIETIRRLLID
jgi:dTDP-4-amino-4,6-dideoxygalactose transaminase